MSASPDTPRSWKEVHLGHEAERIRKRRQVAFGFTPPKGAAASDQPSAPSDEIPPVKSEEHLKRRPDDLFGLALSGGGIRSALFNDGFLQALSHRGLLRFVDHLSSVSGGGYIAGHLTASGARYRDSHPATSFHDEEVCYQMGKNPRTGEAEAGRIENAGSYLERNTRLLFRYVAAWAFKLMLFAGALGAVSALIAIGWRSLDRSTFREQAALLDLDFGGDFSYAFLPWTAATLFWFLSVFAQLVIGLVYYWFLNPRGTNRRNPLESKKWNLLNFRLGIASALCAVIGLAIFLGNSWTRIGQSPSFHLNHSAQWLAIAAGVLRIIALLGRKQLFRSERPEASNLHKTAQVLVANCVVIVAVFAMLHWMGRENISGHTRSRAADLERTDVQDWPAFIAFCNPDREDLSKEVRFAASLLKCESQAWLEEELPSKAKGDWRNFQFRQLIGLPAAPPTEETIASLQGQKYENNICYSGLP